MADHDAKWTTIWMARALAYVIYAYIIIVELLLLQGFLLRLFGADENAGYTQWAYNSLDRVMEPFRGIFTPIEFEGSSVLDSSILFAMVIYGIIAIALRSLLDWLTYRMAKAQSEHEDQVARDAAQANADSVAAAQAYPATPVVTSSPQSTAPQSTTAPSTDIPPPPAP
ncbi:MAG: hypothetical protein DRJ50_00320 [Actinobacteria bacterium]|nr:MAG: hypothetical protein DRJ50_00320 [Actinomycetota bacterium]